MCPILFVANVQVIYRLESSGAATAAVAVAAAVYCCALPLPLLPLYPIRTNPRPCSVRDSPGRSVGRAGETPAHILSWCSPRPVGGSPPPPHRPDQAYTGGRIHCCCNIARKECSVLSACLLSRLRSSDWRKMNVHCTYLSLVAVWPERLRAARRMFVRGPECST